MRIYELTPTTRQKSFYGKAIIEISDNGAETLYSYGTPVIMRTPAGKLVRLWHGWSATTGKHIAAFCGIGKKEWDALPVESEKKSGNLTPVESLKIMYARRNA